MTDSVPTTNRVAAPAPRGEPGLGQLVLLLAASCTAVLGSVLISPVLPLMAREFATTPGVDVLVPVVLTTPALVIGLTAPFAGYLLDIVVDRKRVMVVALLIYAVVGTAPLYLDSLGSILLSRVGVGLCEATIMTCATAMISDNWAGARRARYLSMQILVAALSAVVFFGIGGALGAAGWRAPFWVYALSLVIAAGVAAALREPVRGARPARGERLAPLPWSSLLAPVLLTLVGNVWFYALIVELPFVLTERGVADTALIGIVAAAMSLATALGAIATGRLARRSPRTLLPVELAVTAVGLVVVGTSGSVALIVAGAVLTGFGTGMLLPTLMTWTMNRLATAHRGRGTGIWTAALFLGQFLCPLVVAALAAVAGGLQPALAVLGVAAALGGVAGWRALRGTDEPLDSGTTTVPV